MDAFVLVKYLHYLAIFGVVSSVVAELFLMKDVLSRMEISRLARIDALFGISALIALIAGLTLWFWVGKPSEFYTRNWIFHTKVLIFVIVGVLSIIPTIFFLKNRKGDPREALKVPGHLVIMLRVELVLLLLIPLLAVLMAQGRGAF